MNDWFHYWSQGPEIEYQRQIPLSQAPRYLHVSPACGFSVRLSLSFYLLTEELWIADVFSGRGSLFSLRVVHHTPQDGPPHRNIWTAHIGVNGLLGFGVGWIWEEVRGRSWQLSWSKYNDWWHYQRINTISLKRFLPVYLSKVKFKGGFPLCIANI